MNRLISTIETISEDIQSVGEDREKQTSLTEKLELFQTQLSSSFVLLLRRFHEVLHDYLSDIGADQEYHSVWFQCTVGRLRAVGRDYRKQLKDMRDVLIDQNISRVEDERIAGIFSEIENIYS